MTTRPGAVQDAPPRPASGDRAILAAAGSLQGALEVILRATGLDAAVTAAYGPSGILSDEIAAGRPVDLFISADEGHARALLDSGWASRRAAVARNSLCLLARADLDLHGDGLLTGLLDPALRLGTSTPMLDPCGDCAWAMFARAETRLPGAGARLRSKAQQLAGGRDRAAASPPGNVYGWWIAQGRVDAFLTYRTNALAACAERPGLAIHELPEELRVETVCTAALACRARPPAEAVLDAVLGPVGRELLAARGFGLPELSPRR